MPPLSAGQTPYDAWTLQDFKRVVGDAQDPQAAENALYYDGDHWQDGDGWIGPRPIAGEEGADDTMALIEAGFCSKNVIAEVVDRHMRGVVGREPAWGFTSRDATTADGTPLPSNGKPPKAVKTTKSPAPVPPTPKPKASPVPGTEPPAPDKPGLKPTPVPEGDPQQALIDELEAAVTTWWNERGVHGTIQEAVRFLLNQGRGLLRLYIPAGLLNPDGTATVADLAEAMSLIYIEATDPVQSASYEDGDTKREVVVHMYQDNEKKEHVEATYKGPSVPGDDTAMIETIIRTFGPDGEEEFPLLLGGRLTMHEMRRPLLITQQCIQNQRGINLALTVIPRTVITAGFLERVILNGQMPGEWELDANGDRKRFVPTTMKVGAGTTNFIAGVEQEGKEGELTLTTPNVQWREPVPITSAAEAEMKHYEVILDEVDQLHVLMNKKADVSGLSRQESRTDYEGSLNETKNHVEKAGRWLVETVTALAEQIMGSPGQFTDVLRGNFTCFVDVGPVDYNEQKTTMELVDKNMLSRETGMSRVGVDDVDAEMNIINEQPGAMLELKKKQAEVMKAFVDSGLDHATASTFAGMNTDEVAQITAAAAAVEVKNEAKRAQDIELAAKLQKDGTKPPPGAKPFGG